MSICPLYKMCPSVPYIKLEVGLGQGLTPTALSLTDKFIVTKIFRAKIIFSLLSLKCLSVFNIKCLSVFNKMCLSDYIRCQNFLPNPSTNLNKTLDILSIFGRSLTKSVSLSITKNVSLSITKSVPI